MLEIVSVHTLPLQKFLYINNNSNGVQFTLYSPSLFSYVI